MHLIPEDGHMIGRNM